MIDFLLRRCVKEYQDTQNPLVRQRYGTLSGVVGILLGVPAASVLYTLLKRDVHRRLEEKMPAPEQAEEGTE